MTDFLGKTGPDGVVLPLQRHLADASAVAKRLFDIALTRAQQHWLAEALGVDIDGARQVVAFLAYAHDIGKLSPQFQYGVLSRKPMPGLPAIAVPRKIRHDKIGQVILSRYLRERGVADAAGEALAATIGGHHSIPTKLTRPERLEAGCAESWEPHRTAMLDASGTSIDPSLLRDPGEAVILALAGLVSVSDWIASDAGRFPVTAGERPDSRQLAAAAVPGPAWRPRGVPDQALFTDVFGVCPRATQRTMIDLLVDTELPALLILEDRTGSGKTESALWAALRALQAGARGLYVALPTRATANQAHARVTRFLAALGPATTDVRLLHGGVYAMPSDPLPRDVGDDEDALAAARAWFAGSRRGLLAPYGVGTVDQVLMAVLRERHYPVRFWGAAGKVVVIDEVHSYDAYTGMLLEVLVTWLAALGCTVVLLSATLPSARRGALRAAYRTGLGLVPDESPAPTPGYPRLTLVGGDGDRVVAIDDDRPARTIRLEQLAISEAADAVAEQALSEAADGGCVAVVCNTVASAQERFRALAERSSDIPLVLLHARIRPLERGPIERRLLTELGPDGQRPERLIVVSTQIIEQSLDVDFDVMLSDLAPIDLLVQRAGRVHRHAGRDRPRRHGEPRLIVLERAGAELPSGAAAVYSHAILLRTRIVLRGRQRIEEPADLDDLIERVYGPDAPGGASAEERQLVGELDRKDRREAETRGAWALEGSIGAFGGDAPAWATTLAAVGDGEEPGATSRTSAVTRWSERPSLSVVVLTQEEAARSLGTMDLLQRAVSVSQPRIVRTLLSDSSDAYRPSTWRRHGALRHHYRAVVGDGLSIDWDPILGVCL